MEGGDVDSNSGSNGGVVLEASVASRAISATRAARL